MNYNISIVMMYVLIQYVIHMNYNISIVMMYVNTICYKHEL